VPTTNVFYVGGTFELGIQPITGGAYTTSFASISAQSLEYNTDTDSVWTISPTRIDEVSASSETIVTTYNYVGQSLLQGVFDFNNSRVFVRNTTSGDTEEIDLTSGAITNSISSVVGFMQIDNAKSRLYIWASNTLYEYNSDTLVLNRSITLTVSSCVQIDIISELSKIGVTVDGNVYVVNYDDFSLAYTRSFNNSATRIGYDYNQLHYFYPDREYQYLFDIQTGNDIQVYNTIDPFFTFATAYLRMTFAYYNAYDRRFYLAGTNTLTATNKYLIVDADHFFVTNILAGINAYVPIFATHSTLDGTVYYGLAAAGSSPDIITAGPVVIVTDPNGDVNEDILSLEEVKYFPIETGCMQIDTNVQSQLQENIAYKSKTPTGHEQNNQIQINQWLPAQNKNNVVIIKDFKWVFDGKRYMEFEVKANSTMFITMFYRQVIPKSVEVGRTNGYGGSNYNSGSNI
jgi:hypothetical protein